MDCAGFCFVLFFIFSYPLEQPHLDLIISVITMDVIPLEPELRFNFCYMYI